MLVLRRWIVLAKKVKSRHMPGTYTVHTQQGRWEIETRRRLSVEVCPGSEYAKPDEEASGKWSDKTNSTLATEVIEQPVRSVEMNIPGSCVYSFLRRVFISSMVVSLPDPHFQRQLATSLRTAMRPRWMFAEDIRAVCWRGMLLWLFLEGRRSCSAFSLRRSHKPDGSGSWTTATEVHLSVAFYIGRICFYGLERLMLIYSCDYQYGGVLEVNAVVTVTYSREGGSALLPPCAVATKRKVAEAG
jgi:hypothetical protein